MDTSAADAILAQMTTPAVAVWFMQWLKHARWFPSAWLGPNSPTFILRAWAIGLAIIGGLGVSWEIHGTLWEGGNAVIAWPALATMIGMAYHAVTNLALQEIIYKIHQVTEATTGDRSVRWKQ